MGPYTLMRVPFCLSPPLPSSLTARAACGEGAASARLIQEKGLTHEVARAPRRNMCACTRKRGNDGLREAQRPLLRLAVAEALALLCGLSSVLWPWRCSSSPRFCLPSAVPHLTSLCASLTFSPPPLLLLHSFASTFCASLIYCPQQRGRTYMYTARDCHTQTATHGCRQGYTAVGAPANARS